MAAWSGPRAAANGVSPPPAPLQQSCRRTWPRPWRPVGRSCLLEAAAVGAQAQARVVVAIGRHRLPGRGGSSPALPPRPARPARPARPRRPLTACSAAATAAAVAAAGDRLSLLVARGAAGASPQLFFWLLIFAGFGIPVSEDLLCIYAGAILPQLGTRRRVEVVLALYAGVIVSDWITYLIGRIVGETILKERPAKDGEVARESKIARARRLVQRSGRQVGFFLRLATGLRVPMLLLCGVGRAPFWRAFLPYNLLGGVVSLAAQLSLGAIVFPAAPAAAASGGLAVLLPFALSVALVAALGVFVAQAISRRRAGSLRASSSRSMGSAREEEGSSP